MRRLLLLTTTSVLAGLALAPLAQTQSSLTSFQSPSKNIGCFIDSGSARCDIRTRDWSPPAKPASCELDYGQGLTISRGASRGRFVCAGDTALGSGKVLAYGKSRKRGSITCTSRVAGVTCRNGSGHGFFISRQSYRRF